MRKLIFLLIVIIAGGCGSPRIITAWKAEHSSPSVYRKIMVVAVMNDEKGLLREQVEKQFTGALAKLGYNAVSAVAEFGPSGLSNMSDAETYKKLYTNGIDAVMTVALIDVSREGRRKSHHSYNYPNNYYYNRIRNYKEIAAGPATEKRCFWESILFNLSTLEAECTIQTRTFNNGREGRMTHDFEDQVIKKMIKEKILATQKNTKAF